jgi:hypothetical protein
MSWTIIEHRAGMPAIGSVSAVQEVAIGTRVKADHPTRGQGEFIYLRGAASTAAGDCVTFNQLDGTTVRTLANAIGPVGFATAATVADRFGWYQIYGLVESNTANTVVDNANAFVTATAGAIDDAVVAGDRIKNVRFAGARTGAGKVDIEIWYPYCDDIAE